MGYFITKFPYAQHFKEYQCGGSILAAYHLAMNMAKKNHEINIFTSATISKDFIEKNKNVWIYRYSTNFRMSSSNISFGMFFKPLKHKVDIVHTHFDMPPGPMAGLRYAKKKNVPLILTYHGDWEVGYGNFIRRTGVTFHNKFFVDKILSNAKIIISPSKHYIHESKFLRNHIDKIVVIPNGININDFDMPFSKKECRKKLGLDTDKKILLVLGHLTPYKGPDIAIKAMPKILKNVRGAELVFVGSGNMKNKLELLSKKLGVEKNVKFVGFIGDAYRKALYYKSSDLFLFPSFMDIFGLVNLEAMACSLPIIASDVGGIPDVVKNGENGLLIPPRDPNSLADSVVHLLENETIVKNMGKNGLKKAKKYSWDKITDKTERLYLEYN